MSDSYSFLVKFTLVTTLASVFRRSWCLGSVGSALRGLQGIRKALFRGVTTAWRKSPITRPKKEGRRPQPRSVSLPLLGSGASHAHLLQAPTSLEIWRPFIFYT